LAAQDKFDEATRYLDEANGSPPDAEVERAMRRATLLIAQRKLPEATAAIESALSRASSLPSPNTHWRAQAAMIALLAAQGKQGAARRLAAAQLVELSIHADAGANSTVMEELLYAAGRAARLGLVDEASEALNSAQRHGLPDRFPVRTRLAAIAQAEIDLRAGRADEALARLQPDAGSELWEVHELRARVLRASGDTTGEKAELTWLTTRRGLAYGQWIDQMLGQQARVLAFNESKGRLADLGRPH
jgi:tetratricopeptide (TPR) repeat protein